MRRQRSKGNERTAKLANEYVFRFMQFQWEKSAPLETVYRCDSECLSMRVPLALALLKAKILKLFSFHDFSLFPHFTGRHESVSQLRTTMIINISFRNVCR